MAVLMLTRKKPGITSAREFLLLYFQQEGVQAGLQLPSLRRCARAANVSLVTIWKAVQERKKENALFVTRGQRVAFGPKPSSNSDQTARMRLLDVNSRWATVAAELERDIINGH